MADREGNADRVTPVQRTRYFVENEIPVLIVSATGLENDVRTLIDRSQSMERSRYWYGLTVAFLLASPISKLIAGCDTLTLYEALMLSLTSVCLSNAIRYTRSNKGKVTNVHDFMEGMYAKMKDLQGGGVTLVENEVNSVAAQFYGDIIAAVFGCETVSEDVTQKVKDIVAKYGRQFKVTIDVLGDPCIGYLKTLTVQYMRNGTAVEKTAAENEIIDLS